MLLQNCVPMTGLICVYIPAAGMTLHSCPAGVAGACQRSLHTQHGCPSAKQSLDHSSTLSKTSTGCKTHFCCCCCYCCCLRRSQGAHARRLEGAQLQYMHQPTSWRARCRLISRLHMSVVAGQRGEMLRLLLSGVGPVACLMHASHNSTSG